MHGRGFNTVLLNSKMIARCGMAAALSVGIMFLTTVFQTLSLALAAISGFVIAFIVMRYGKIAATLTYAASAAIVFFFVPDRGAAILYVAFFGIYPVLKSVFENIKSRVLEWVCKIIFAGGIIFLAIKLFSLNYFYLLSIFVFVLYDIVFSKVIFTYGPKLNKIIK